jgi:hypothetical protein
MTGRDYDTVSLGGDSLHCGYLGQLALLDAWKDDYIRLDEIAKRLIKNLL